jgi:F-type H+-transporting ATPase subunit b
MKNFFYGVFKNGSIALIVILLWLLSGEALAAEGSGTWRPTYDLIMRYINFLILAFLILKYARKPLADFFKGRAQDVKEDIQNIEEAKELAQEQVKVFLEERDKSRERFEQLKERIISQGRAKQQDIIDGARLGSRLLIESAQRKIDNRILTAKQTLRSEMIDMAIDMAMEKLPKTITDQDNQRFLDHYLEHERSFKAPSQPGYTEPAPL